MPKVSIVLPSYNRAPTLARSINSVLAQTFEDFELLIIDDGSTDNTREVVSEFLFDPRIRYIFQENAGAAIARNRGIEESKGTYIAFQDSDDEWEPDKLAKQLRVFDSGDSSLSLVYSSMLRINKDGSECITHAPDIRDGRLFNENTHEFQVFGIGLVSCLIRKQDLISVGGFDDQLPRFIDLELFIRLSKSYKFHLIEDALVKYYATEGISTNRRNAAIAREMILKKYCDEARSFPTSLAYHYLQIAGCYWKVEGAEAEKKKFCSLILKSDQADFMTKVQAVLLLIVPRSIGKLILGR